MNYINTALLILSVFSFNSCENNNSRKAARLFEQGQMLALSNKPDSAILYYREAIELVKEAPDNELTGSIYNHAGNLFFSADIYDKACEAYQTPFPTIVSWRIRHTPANHCGGWQKASCAAANGIRRQFAFPKRKDS